MPILSHSRWITDHNASNASRVMDRGRFRSMVIYRGRIPDVTASEARMWTANQPERPPPYGGNDDRDADADTDRGEQDGYKSLKKREIRVVALKQWDLQAEVSNRTGPFRTTKPIRQLHAAGRC